MPKVTAMPEESKRIYADVTSKQVNGLELGEAVTVTYTGKVIELTAARKYDYGDNDKGTYPPTIGVKVAKMKVEAGENVFDDLANDEDGD
ncbi:hypothetical protein CMI37_11425 [Candidatus Pacearchaeota archaeon]|nr:hypothetical protein [Candidatus Pacearchaeota archaeon]